MADEAGFDAFVVARSGALLRTAYLLVHDEDLAEDLLQTALAKAWFAWRRIEGDPEPYVRRILVTTSASWWRRKWTAGAPTAELPEPADARVERCDRQDLWQALGQLPATPARGGGAALPRGPLRGRDRAAARLLGRHGQEPVRQGAGQAADRPGAGCASTRGAGHDSRRPPGPGRQRRHASRVDPTTRLAEVHARIDHDPPAASGRCRGGHRGRGRARPYRRDRGGPAHRVTPRRPPSPPRAHSDSAGRRRQGRLGGATPGLRRRDRRSISGDQRSTRVARSGALQRPTTALCSPATATSEPRNCSLYGWVLRASGSPTAPRSAGSAGCPGRWVRGYRVEVSSAGSTVVWFEPRRTT